jgi:cell division GTPase FtsZ
LDLGIKYQDYYFDAALTVAVVTLPFASEGRTRMHNALQGLESCKNRQTQL